MEIDAIFNTSPLIFLSKLDLLEESLVLFETSFITEEVLDEILTHRDSISEAVNNMVSQGKLFLLEISNKNLGNPYT